MIKRFDLTYQVQKAIRRSRVVVLVGPRQCGKTTLAREFLSPDNKNYFDKAPGITMMSSDSSSFLV